MRLLVVGGGGRCGGRGNLLLLGDLAVHLVAPAQVLLGPVDVAALQLGRFVQRPRRVGQVRARDGAQVGAAGRDDAVGRGRLR
jgi:hypothetical protein